MAEIFDFYTKKNVKDEKKENVQFNFKTWMPTPIVPRPNFKPGDIIVKITELDIPNNDNTRVYPISEYVEKNVTYSMPWLDDIRRLNLTAATLDDAPIVIEWALMDKIEEIIKTQEEEKEK